MIRMGIDFSAALPQAGGKTKRIAAPSDSLGEKFSGLRDRIHKEFDKVFELEFLLRAQAAELEATLLHSQCTQIIFRPGGLFSDNHAGNITQRKIRNITEGPDLYRTVDIFFLFLIKANISESKSSLADISNYADLGFTKDGNRYVFNLKPRVFSPLPLFPHSSLLTIFIIESCSQPGPQ